MGLLDVVRSGVAIANQLTADLQPNVSHEAYVSSDGAGRRVYSPAVSRPALVIRKQKLVRSATGEMVMSQAQITILDPAVVINELDKFTLPDNTSGPIIATDGFVDRLTGHPILTEIYLGSLI
jgi:hypothetical protein